MFAQVCGAIKTSDSSLRAAWLGLQLCPMLAGAGVEEPLQTGGLSARGSQPTPPRTAGCREGGWLSGNKFHRSGLFKELESFSKHEAQPARDTVILYEARLMKDWDCPGALPQTLILRDVAWECLRQASTYRPASLLAPRRRWLSLTWAGSYGAN